MTYYIYIYIFAPFNMVKTKVKLILFSLFNLLKNWLVKLVVVNDTKINHESQAKYSSEWNEPIRQNVFSVSLNFFMSWDKSLIFWGDWIFWYQSSIHLSGR
jgi:hypothetical protein